MQMPSYSVEHSSSIFHNFPFKDQRTRKAKEEEEKKTQKKFVFISAHLCRYRAGEKQTQGTHNKKTRNKT
jgi:hypothetical protein